MELMTRLTESFARLATEIVTQKRIAVANISMFFIPSLSSQGWTVGRIEDLASYPIRSRGGAGFLPHSLNKAMASCLIGQCFKEALRHSGVR